VRVLSHSNQNTSIVTHADHQTKAHPNYLIKR
jgi:hypothetical protein